MRRRYVLVLIALALAAAPAAAHRTPPPVNGPTLPANDLEAAIALTGGKLVGPSGPVRLLQTAPPRVPPSARCDADSAPVGDPVQGRVPASALASEQAARGWTCNLERVATVPTPGGFRTWRYTDRAGHVCAFYDTSITSPASALSTAFGPSEGVVVLDLSDSSKPRRTATLTSAAMLAPHESLNLNEGRGLLAANTGNGTTLPGSIAVYDVAQDCRAPRLLSELPVLYGHESGFSPDGRTYWVAGGAGEVQAIDLTDPTAPRVLWRGAMYSHGLGVSEDGRTLYQTDPINGSVGILDVGEVQDRKPSPSVREVSRITWDPVSIPQNAVPLRLGGRPHLLEFDEFAFRFNPVTLDHGVGGARLIDISDPAKPMLTSELRLEVNQREVHREVSDDPSPLPPGRAFGYSAHYCGVPRPVDPEIVACSFVNSGLRVFDIRDPRNPREVASYLAPQPPGPDGGRQPNFAMSQPAFDAKRREVWYTDSFSGFHVLRLDPATWPRTRTCVSRRRITITLPRRLREARIRYAGRTAKPRRRGRSLRAMIDLRGLPKRTVVVRITGRDRMGRVVRLTRTFRTCRPKPL